MNRRMIGALALLSAAGCAQPAPMVDDASMEASAEAAAVPDARDDQREEDGPSAMDAHDSASSEDAGDAVAIVDASDASPQGDASTDAAADVAPPRGTVEIVAGSTSTGYLDGFGAQARFSGPSGAALSADGRTMYVADTFNSLLRVIDVTTGATRTVAGRLQVQSVVNGTGADARFQSPRAMVLTNDGSTLYLADGPTIRRVDTRTFAVTTLAGTAGMSGYADGTGAVVRLGFLLHSFALSADERTLYIADRSNRVLRTLDVSVAPMMGEVRTVAGTRYTGAEVHADGVGAVARFSGLGGILRVGGTLYVADTFNHVLRAVELATMTVRTITGRPGVAGIEDGPATEATFDAPQSLATDGASLFVTSFQGILRRVSLTDLRTSTPLGVFEEVFARDGDARSARLGVAFGPPMCDATRRVLYFNDRDASSVRAINLDTFAITTVAGAQDVSFVRDGAAVEARFDGASELVVTADGARAYTADSNGRTVREIDLRARTVRTLAGAFASAGNTDGAFADARFGSPSGLALDEANGRLFVSDSRFNTIRALDLRGSRVSTLAGDGAAAAASTDGMGATARFNGPARLCLLGSTLYVADSANRSLRAVDVTSGAVTTVAGSSANSAATVDGPLAMARFRSLSGLACDAAGRRVFVADSTAHTLRVVDLGAGTVQTLSGRDMMSGPADGALGETLFRGPRGLWLNAARTALYVADQSNHSVRRVDLAGMRVSTLVGSPSRNGGLVAGRAFAIEDATLYFPTGIAGVGADLLLFAEDALHVVRPRDAL
jgi:DNA-binding beta-propeller fold protein YncE